MNRISEKVKDIVEVRPWTHLSDFAADPGLTLAGYHFTDITAELMAKWIDRVADVGAGRGGAFALAGFRGVGKSHFLAALGSIIAQPELRSRIADAHVAASAERLSRKHGTVVRVRRGSDSTLLEELRRAIADVVGVNAATLSESLNDLLLKGVEKAGELPMVVLIDTALGRDAHVSRDDGQFLSQIAEAAKTLGVFVGVALDDDIAGADGANSSISASFGIDYLDQEHLYKIVDAHIFSKHSQKLSVLQELYQDYRNQLPGFRWSEQRFTSLYPLHPAILENAPIIRLYVHDFALLGFASEAGVKILGRPANSLIGLDEVFDNVERKLRAVTELTDAFAAFDKIETEVIAKMPVHSRLRAKLLLKGLFTLSLNGQGATAAEIAAAMTIFSDAQTQVIGIDELLESFAAALPEVIQRSGTDDAAPKYLFKLSAKDDRDKMLEAAISEVSGEAVWSTLARLTGEKFSDAGATADGLEKSLFSIEWRRAIRRCSIEWPSSVNDGRATNGDLRIVVNEQISGLPSAAVAEDSLTWNLASLSKEEADTVIRFHLLQNHAVVRESYGERIATAMHIHSIAVEKIWQRIFLCDAVLIDAEVEYRFDEGAQGAHNLAHLFSATLGPILASRCPLHPEFSRSLDGRNSSALISDFFGGGDPSSNETQRLAEDFAVPLGLAVKSGEVLIPAPTSSLMDLGIVQLVLTDHQSDATISLEEISSRLLSSPFGLTREAQQIVLAALVAQRQFEFVTSSGNRINHRSLDLSIIWDDIVGIAKPLADEYSAERLIAWAKLITGNSAIVSLERSEDRLLIIDSLSTWLSGWRENYTLAGFDELPDANLNATIWKTAASVRRAFEAMAAAIENLIENGASLDQCLHTIADLFADSEEDFTKKNADLRTIRNWTANASEYNAVSKYLLQCPVTGNRDVEAARQDALELLESRDAAGKFLESLQSFKNVYTEYYRERHDAAMSERAGLAEALQSDSWLAFESFSSLPQIARRYEMAANKLIREARNGACKADVAAELSEQPHCVCGFDPRDAMADAFSGRLSRITDTALKFFADSLTAEPKALTAILDELAPDKEDRELRANVGQVLEDVAATGFVPFLAAAEIRLIKLAATRLAASQPRRSTGNDAVMFDQNIDAFLPAL